jgi:hypothetical protein
VDVVVDVGGKIVVDDVCDIGDVQTVSAVSTCCSHKQ